MFPGGKVEPGEAAAAAAVREVMEETGLAVEVRGEIGRRHHPITGTDIVYLAARPANATTVSASAELVELRWASAAEALGLMPSMFDPVRDHLRRSITS